MQPLVFRVRSVPTLVLVLALAGCGSSGGGSNPVEPAPTTPVPPTAPAAPVPAVGTAGTLDVGSWNIEWFGSRSNGPANDSLQADNARRVLVGTDLDIWGVAEIVDQAAWDALESRLPGYTGFLAGEPHVVDGPTFYSAGEQKVGVLFKSSVATLVGARVILTANDSDFAGRPPLEVTLRLTLNGSTEDVVFIVLHAKAFNDEASRQRRATASAALKAHLDSRYPTQKVFVVGDFNDDVDTSITPAQPSPYQNFSDDAQNYRFPTRVLSEAGVSSTTRFTDLIDHHLNSNEATATYVQGSAQVYRVDAFISSFDTTTSDHYPVLTRYTFGGGQ